jgi:hypothetical protein
MPPRRADVATARGSILFLLGRRRGHFRGRPLRRMFAPASALRACFQTHDWVEPASCRWFRASCPKPKALIPPLPAESSGGLRAPPIRQDAGLDRLEACSTHLKIRHRPFSNAPAVCLRVLDHPHPHPHFLGFEDEDDLVAVSAALCASVVKNFPQSSF